MINKFEIARIAKKHGLQSSTIEKDYVLGWILIGIQNHSHKLLLRRNFR